MELFKTHTNKFRIVRIGGESVPNSKLICDLRELIVESEYLYPEINLWFDKKVNPGLKTGERRGIVVYADEQPFASAVLRRGEDAKLCSMRIKEDFSFKGIGTLIMSLVGIELRNDRSDLIHFTIPEDIWMIHKQFFSEYGFNEAGLAGTQYRLFNKEIACAANFQIFWTKVKSELPNLALDYKLGFNDIPDILMSINPKYADKILSGQKRVEIRVNFPTRWVGAVVIFYASEPEASVIGHAKISHVEKGTPNEIWGKYESEIGCTYEEFMKYSKNHLIVSALKLDNVESYQNRVSRPQLESIMNEELRPPQSYTILKNNKDWTAALTLGVLIRSSL